MTSILAMFSHEAVRIAFEIAGPAYERLTRTLEVRTAKHERAGAASARQPLGFDETLEIEGALFPLWRGRVQTIDELRAAARAQVPLLFTDGRGMVHGRWLIETVETDETLADIDGRARKIEFRVALGRTEGQGGLPAPAQPLSPSGQGGTPI